MKKHILIVAILALIVALPVMDVDATQYTKTYVRTEGPDDYGAFLKYTHTFAAATDTFIMGTTYAIPRTSGSVSTPLTLAIITNSGHADSVLDMSVRYQVSMDNVTWQGFTIGTDSTTWDQRSATLQIFPLAVATYGGYMPYSRIYGFGNTGNAVSGGVVTIGFIEQ